MKVQLREQFDRLLQEVLEELPPHLVQLFDEMPLVVEDYPDPLMLEELGMSDRGELCGLHSGIPLTHRSVEHSGVLPSVIHIFREGVLHAAADDCGAITDKCLKRQIRITVLHELGHHFGFDEQQLRQYGYG